MMRLIDADAFLERTRKDPLFPLVERYGLSGVIENEPTVDAIPIEWIEKWLDEFLGTKLEEEINGKPSLLLYINEYKDVRNIGFEKVKGDPFYVLKVKVDL